jgi:hypothetical protein
VHSYQSSRKPPTVIDTLVLEMYPNFVDTINRMKPVLTWEDFKKTTIARVSTSKRVLEEFWVCVTCT